MIQMKKTVAYLRASTNDQDTAHQKSSIIRFAESNNLVIDDWYEEYISGYRTSIEDREKIQKVKELALNGELSNLIIFEQSRLARNMSDGIGILDTFTRCNVKVYSVKDNRCINQNELDKLMNAFQSFFSEQSSRDTSLRIKSAKKLQKEKGEWMGGKIPFGFTVKDKKLMVDKDKIDIVKELYHIYCTQGCREAIDFLSDYDDRYKVNYTMLHLLENPIMIQIVGQDIYNDFMTIKQSRHNEGSVRTNRSTVKLEGLLFHDECGGKLTIDYDRGQIRFRCRRCKEKRATIKKTFSGKRLIENVEHEIISLLDNLDRDKLVDQYNKDSNRKTNLLHMQIERTEKALRDKKKELAKAESNMQKLLVTDMDLSVIEITSGIIKQMKETIAELTEELDTKRKELEAEKLRADKIDESVDNLLDFRYLYRHGNNEQQKIILGQLIEKIVVRDIDDFDIYLNITGYTSLPQQRLCCRPHKDCVNI